MDKIYKGIITYEISESEIKKEIDNYKKSVKTSGPGLTDEEIRDLCIKSLVKYKVGLRSYVNPEKENSRLDKILYEWRKASEKPCQEVKEVFVVMLEKKIDGETSLKPAYAEWRYDHWLNEKDWTVVEWLKEVQPSLTINGIKAIAMAAFNYGYLTKMDDAAFEKWFSEYVEKDFPVQPSLKEDEAFIQDALNAYFHQTVKELERKDLGDIERKNLENIKTKCDKIFKDLMYS